MRRGRCVGVERAPERALSGAKRRPRGCRFLASAILGAFLAVASANESCHRSTSAGSHDAAVALPVVLPDGGDLLLTWIDDKGDFHVETRVADVPLMGRDTVRVEAETGDHAMNPDQVIVVDLRQTGVDGAYPVRTMARAEFEAIAVARREKSGPTLANGVAPPAPPPGSPAASSQAASKSAAVVIIYGAEWCSACHDAERYLRHKGIAYIEKDVEKDRDAAREMQAKLAKSGLRGGSIPVIDVRGKVMVGFNPAEVDAALGAPL